MIKSHFPTQQEEHDSYSHMFLNEMDLIYDMEKELRLLLVLFGKSGEIFLKHTSLLKVFGFSDLQPFIPKNGEIPMTPGLPGSFLDFLVSASSFTQSLFTLFSYMRTAITEDLSKKISQVLDGISGLCSTSIKAEKTAGNEYKKTLANFQSKRLKLESERNNLVKIHDKISSKTKNGSKNIAKISKNLHESLMHFKQCLFDDENAMFLANTAHCHYMRVVTQTIKELRDYKRNAFSSILNMLFKQKKADFESMASNKSLRSHSDFSVFIEKNQFYRRTPDFTQFIEVPIFFSDPEFVRPRSLRMLPLTKPTPLYIVESQVDFQSSEPGELNTHQNKMYIIYDPLSFEWVFAKCPETNSYGYVPSSILKLVSNDFVISTKPQIEYHTVVQSGDILITVDKQEKRTKCKTIRDQEIWIEPRYLLNISI